MGCQSTILYSNTGGGGGGGALQIIVFFLQLPLSLDYLVNGVLGVVGPASSGDPHFPTTTTPCSTQKDPLLSELSNSHSVSS